MDQRPYHSNGTADTQLQPMVTMWEYEPVTDKSFFFFPRETQNLVVLNVILKSLLKMLAHTLK